MTLTTKYFLVSPFMVTNTKFRLHPAERENSSVNNELEQDCCAFPPGLYAIPSSGGACSDDMGEEVQSQSSSQLRGLLMG